MINWPRLGAANLPGAHLVEAGLRDRAARRESIDGT